MHLEQRRGWLAGLTLALLATTHCGSPPPADSVASAASAVKPADTDDKAIAVGQLAHGELPSSIPIEADDTIVGASTAPVTLVAFVDFQCPFCARAHRTVKALQQSYGAERLRVVLKHLPLDFHQNALPAALAAQAVRVLGGHGKAQQYADRLLEEQHALSSTNFLTWAEALGIHRHEFEELLSDPRLLGAIQNDVELAARHGINGTPTFLLNGFELTGAQPSSEFNRVIERELRAAENLSRQGIAPEEIYALRVKKNLDADTADAGETGNVYRVPIDGSPTLGPDDALVTIVEFSEFQCPFCDRVRPTLELLRQRFSKDVRLVFKHLPLDFHEHALPAARLSAEIHRTQGSAAFWKAADLLFESTLQERELLEIGTSHGLSEAQAKSAIFGEAGQQRVDRDLNLSEDLKARGTPHFFINGRRLSGARPYPQFERLVLRAITEAKQSLTEGVAPKDYYEHVMRNADPLEAPREVTASISEEGKPSWGPETAPVVIHVFSDFQCSYCARAESTLEELRQAFPKKLKIVWHNLPLPFHEHARTMAAAALEAYAQQGKQGFYRMHAALFQRQQEPDRPSVSTEELLTIAKNLGFDSARLQAALAKGRHDAAIDADLKVAKSLEINGTPGFVVDRWLFTGAKPVRYFRTLVERALETR